MRPAQIWQQRHHNKVSRVMFSLTLGRPLHYFLVLLLLILNFLCLLWISLNATLRHISAEYQIGVI